MRSKEARREESTTGDLYDQVYEAERPELFFKAAGWRVAGDGMPIRVRADSRWNVPEPELVLVVNRHRQIVGYCAGNDVSSREIEGQNPLYLPQAKVYTGSCALGPGIRLSNATEIMNLPIRMEIARAGVSVYAGEASTASLKRTPQELVSYLTQELEFPQGVFLMTGTCLVPEGDFSLQPGDVVTIQVGDLLLKNPVGV
jgi:2-dehydro-3-deoxy-D-arabinonate dehydratase